MPTNGFIRFSGNTNGFVALCDYDPKAAEAMNQIPAPASFRKAAVAIRKIIRAKKKSRMSAGDEISALHWLAAIRSFFPDTRWFRWSSWFMIKKRTRNKRIRKRKL